MSAEPIATESDRQAYIRCLEEQEAALIARSASHTGPCLQQSGRHLAADCICGAAKTNAPLDLAKESVHRKMAEVAPEMVASIHPEPEVGAFAEWLAAPRCPNPMHAHLPLVERPAAKMTPEQAFCGRWLDCQVPGCYNSELTPSVALERQLSEMKSR